LPVRFPFTFLGVMALVIGLWVIVYLVGHRELDPFSRGLAIAAAVGSWAFGGYVVIRRVRRGPQH
jgi:type VI protein secretion system component VasK